MFSSVTVIEVSVELSGAVIVAPESIVNAVPPLV
jgi:hypothetical protein